MIKLFLCFLLGGLLIICSAQRLPVSDPAALLQQYRAMEQIYQQAEKISLHAKDAVAKAYADSLYDLALSWCQKLIPPSRQAAYDSLSLFLNISAGAIYSKKERADSANIYFDLALQENATRFPAEKNTPYGMLLTYKGDQLAESGRYYEAIQQYHAAILQFHQGFNEPNVYENPTTFTDSLPYSLLFDVLNAKASAFEQLRPGKKNIKALNGALSAYHSAALLTAFIEKSFDTEEATTFLSLIKYNKKNGSLKVNLDLFGLTNDKHHLEEAYRLDQYTKISFLPPDMKKDIINQLPSIAGVQQLIDTRTAILSYHLSGQDLIAIVITRNEAAYHIEPVGQDFFQSLDSFRLAVSRTDRYDPAYAMDLYETFVLPLQEKLTGIRRLIIIPDQRHRYLPFEAFQKADKRYLLEEYTVQYQSTTALLGRELKREKKVSPIVWVDTIISYDSLLHKNRIITLWKSEDTTAIFIKKQLYKYLENGYSRDQALQKARLDLVKDDEIDPRYKLPAHWARFAYIGQYEPPYTPTPWLLIAVIASVVVAIVWVITIKSNF